MPRAARGWVSNRDDRRPSPPSGLGTLARALDHGKGLDEIEVPLGAARKAVREAKP